MKIYQYNEGTLEKKLDTKFHTFDVNDVVFVQDSTNEVKVATGGGNLLLIQAFSHDTFR